MAGKAVGEIKDLKKSLNVINDSLIGPVATVFKSYKMILRLYSRFINMTKSGREQKVK